MLDEIGSIIFTIFKKVWRRKDLRPHLANAALTLLLSLLVFFYINARHDEAMASIKTQESIGQSVLNKLDKVGDRVDDLYRLVARRVR